MRDAELTERDDAADRLRVLAWIRHARFVVRARRVRLARTRQWRRDVLSRGGDDAPVESSDRDFVAGLRDRVRRGGVELRISVADERVAGRRCLDEGAVVEEMFDGNLAGESLH